MDNKTYEKIKKDQAIIDLANQYGDYVRSAHTNNGKFHAYLKFEDWLGVRKNGNLFSV